MAKNRGALLHPKPSKAEDAKKLIDRAYAEEQEEYVKGKIHDTERAHESYKISLAWSVVNEISGRKVSSRGRMCDSYPKERVQ